MPKGAGFITLLSVLVLGAVGLSVSVSLLLLSLGNSRTSFAVGRSGEAKALANACAERALDELRHNPAYGGEDPIVLGNGTCTVTVLGSGASGRRVQAVGAVGSLIRKVEIIIDQTRPRMVILSWQEVADF